MDWLEHDGRRIEVGKAYVRKSWDQKVTVIEIDPDVPPHSGWALAIAEGVRVLKIRYHNGEESICGPRDLGLEWEAHKAEVAERRGKGQRLDAVAHELGQILGGHQVRSSRVGGTHHVEMHLDAESAERILASLKA